MFISVRAKNCCLLPVRSKTITGCPDVLGGNLGKFSVILVCVVSVNKYFNVYLSVACYSRNFIRKIWSIFCLLYVLQWKSCVLSSMLISASSTISWSGSRGADNISGYVLVVGWWRSEGLLMKMRLTSMSIERLARRELVKILSGEKSISFSTWEDGIANVMVDRRVSIGNLLCRSTYPWRTFLCLKSSYLHPKIV